MAGSAYDLLAIVRENRETTRAYLGMRPWACPIDGATLVTHPRAAAILHCPFCGYEPTGMDHP